jgi:yersiniabactin nonribosomal peptide/polyketide synthase
MQRCYRHALDFVIGRRTGVSIVFPRGDMSLWERVHREDAVMSIYSSMVPIEMAKVLRPRSRVLEVGAGVGAVLRKCLPVLKQRDTLEFWFTDLGRLFVQRAELDFSGDDMMRFAVLDLDRPLAAQGLEPGSFDIVTGVNVLHSARNLEFSLRELRSILRKGGSLILGEGSPPRRGRRWRLDFVFAFLRGWWDVTLDRVFRPRPGFLFPDEWTSLLRHCGYSNAQAIPGEHWFAGDCRGGLLVASK